MVVLPAMPPEQTASWLGLLDLYDRSPDGWTLIGGQLVHLYCAERGQFQARPTNDADTVIDVRADPTILDNLYPNARRPRVPIGGHLSGGSSAPAGSAATPQSTFCCPMVWAAGVPRNAKGATGSPTLPTQGGTQALKRSEAVAVTVSGREGRSPSQSAPERSSSRPPLTPTLATRPASPPARLPRACRAGHRW